MKKRESSFEAPITGQRLVGEQCKNCAFRIRKPFKDFDGKIKDRGWMRGDCYKYPVVKPNVVLKNLEKCECYEKD